MKIPKRSLQKSWRQVMFIPEEKLQTSGGCGQSGREQQRGTWRSHFKGENTESGITHCEKQERGNV